MRDLPRSAAPVTPAPAWGAPKHSQAGGVLEDNSELIRESIRESIQESLRKSIQESIQERIDYDLRVRLPQTLARANALQMAFDSC